MPKVHINYEQNPNRLMIMKMLFIPIRIAANGKTGHLVKMMKSHSPEIYLRVCVL